MTFVGKRRLPGGGFICPEGGLFVPKENHYPVLVVGGVPYPPQRGGPVPLPTRGSRTFKNRKNGKFQHALPHGGVFWRLGKACEQVPALICDSYARSSLRAAAIWGDFADREQNLPLKYLGRNLRLLTKISSSVKISQPPTRTRISSTPFSCWAGLTRFFSKIRVEPAQLNYFAPEPIRTRISSKPDFPSRKSGEAGST